MKKRFGRQQAGFTLIETIISVGVLGIASASAVGFMQYSLAHNKKLQTRSTVLQVKTDIYKTLSNQQNWETTILKANTHIPGSDNPVNPELACVRDGSVCATGEHSLTLLRKDGSVYLDSRKTNLGFTDDGIQCQTYGSTDKSNTCLYQYKVTWKPICEDPSNCIRPQISTKVALTSINGSASSSATQVANELSMLVPQPNYLPPVAKRVLKYTNSTAVYNTDSQIMIEPLQSVVSSHQTEIVPFTTATSQSGGVVAYVSPTQVTYKPKENFFGTDFFYYSVRDVITKKIARGTMNLRVMTPYTWTGLAGSGDIFSSNPKNFCGKVVDGVCDGATFPSSGWGLGAWINVIFDSTCTVCDAKLDSIGGSYPLLMHTLETTSSYRGKVEVVSNGGVGGAGGPWHKPVSVLIAGGTFDASAVSDFYIDGSDRGWGYSPPYWEDYALKVKGAGRYISARNSWMSGALFIESPVHFAHNNGTITLASTRSRNNLIYAPGVEFYNFNFGGGLGIKVSSSFTVLKDVHVIPKGNGYDYVGTGSDPFTTLALPSNPTVSIGGNLVLDGSGGNHCAGSCGGVNLELNGTGDQSIQGVALGAIPLSLSNSWSIPSAPSISINKTSGKTTMTGTVGIRRDFRVLNIADYDFSTSKLVFNGSDCTNSYFTPGPATEFNDFYDLLSSCSGSINMGTTNINIRGNYYHYSTGDTHIYGDSYGSAKLKLYGDFYVAGSKGYTRQDRSVTAEFVGTGDQTIRRMPEPDGSLPDSSMATINWIIDKPSGNLLLEGRLGTTADITVRGSNFIAKPGSVIYNNSYGWNGFKTTLDAESAQFESIEVGHNMVLASNIKTRNLKLGMPSSKYYGTGVWDTFYKFQVSKDLELLYGNGVNHKIELIGDQVQKVSFTGDAAEVDHFSNTDIVVNKTSGSVNFMGTGPLRKVCVNTPTFTMDPASSLTIANKIGVVDATYFLQNGGTVLGTITSPDSSCSL